jgi:hypothetical protein
LNPEVTVSIEVRWVAVVGAMLLGATPLAAQSLKDTQKAIRERILTEAGSDDLIYSRVDFNDCAVTVQTRTPRGLHGEETRTTYTFHATSLDSGVTNAAEMVTLGTAGARASLRRLEQRIDSGGVKETVSSVSSIEFRFAQESTAVTVKNAFKRLTTVCTKNNPFKGTK